jgi:outer membrane lipoprotein SlyB
MQRQSLRTAGIAGTVALASLLAACASPGYQQPVSSYPASAPVATYPAQGAPAMVEYGRVSNIEVMRTEGERRNNAVGAVIGAVVGAVVGNQIGSGSGRAVATGVGAVGGAVAGNAIQNRQPGAVQESYRVSVQVDNGNFRAYDVPSTGDLRVGDRVRIQGGQLQRV